MKNLFSISEEEKQRILEMHSSKKVMSEQIKMPTSIKPLRKGDLINLYDVEKNIEARYLLQKFEQDLNGIVRLTLKTSGKPAEGGKGESVVITVTFDCGFETLKTPSKTDEEGKDVTKEYKSDSLISQLRNQFCQKNKAGKWVPKAAYAAVGQIGEPMA